jgi:ribosomal protein L16 Arg81 hydroxylase
VSGLTRLIEDGGILHAAYYRREPVVLRDAVALDGLPGVAEVDGWIAGSLLRRPYFAVMHEGVRPPDSEVLATRKVAGARATGFMDEAGVHKQLADGATLKLNQVEDFHPYIRAINDELNSIFPAESKAYLFYTPAGKRGMLPHRDGQRVIAIQIEGTKEWHFYDEPAEAGSTTGLDVDTSSSQVVIMTPGDVLYLPHGHAHAATAIDQTSLHLTFTLMEPSPTALAQAYIAEWVAAGQPATTPSGEDALSLAVRAKIVLEDLAHFGETLDSRSLIDRALVTGRCRDTSR